ncbi:unnamed protein product [Candidula unifasciata]|uniref:Uncharacterized protein n=1 Tax=Candidula unifasciata TaxID=100452 RepID=A0A8S3YJR3_9EUPU|nr:unnamed protein product [Candidula unifasciata]
MIKVHPRAAGAVISASQTLQEICCTAISLHCEQYPLHMIEELSLPCLDLLVQHLSMFDLLRLEQFLQARGINAKHIMFGLHRKLFQSGETYPIKATTCPHLLNLFPCDGMEWGLSRLLFRRTIAVLVEEYNSSEEQYRNFQNGSQEHLVMRNECLMEMFCPPSGCFEEDIKAKLSRLPMMVENLTVMAAKKILFLTVDYRILKFLQDKRCENILQSLYESVVVVSLLMKSTPHLVDFVRNIRKYGNKFERVCIYGIKRNDLLFLDEVLSLCSGVVEYGSTPQGQQDKEALRQIMLADDCMEEIFHSHTDPEFDLMDDAVLLGTPDYPSKFDSTTGMLKADFKFTNLVKIEYYALILNHHLKSWLALQELHIGVPCLHPKTVKCLCYVLQRPQFRCFTLSSASVVSSVIEDLLCAVASRRNSNPLEKLMFVSVQENVESFVDLLVTDQLITKSQDEIADFFKVNESQKLAQFHGFQGTKLLEVTQCTLSARAEVMICQFVLKCQALETLCVSNSISRVILQTVLKSMSNTIRPLNSLILEDWHILRDASCEALISLLRSVSPSLQTLSLRGCVTVDGSINFKDIIESVAACKNLKQIDISENKLGNEGIQFVTRILENTNVAELSLRRNDMSKAAICSIIKSSVDIMRKRRPLDLLDLRGNCFSEDDRNQQQALLKDVARHVLVDPNSS